MRYLNKIVFINSADKALKYAEISLDGNVHFIGTQGVGKSTLLRAILFFYNADTQKLGIPREKKNYNEYYFPYQNSYIIYEVHAETADFCVLSFRTQGRVAFRFLDSGYRKEFFINDEGKAFDSWEHIRQKLDAVGYTRIINNYEEYRNILYGNNKGLTAEFRKYALLNSRQYQNIPRTIANVFLNAKLDAEFVKQTIIKSLNEEEVKIDLTTYSQTHLRDFEANLTDIQKWTERNLQTQAKKVIETSSALAFLQRDKKEKAQSLAFALNRAREEQPRFLEDLRREQQAEAALQRKLSELEDVFEKKKRVILHETGEVTSKLKEIKKKQGEYAVRQIDHIIARVAQKPNLLAERDGLLREKELLTSRFLEIQQRYEALIKEVKGRLQELINQKNKEQNEVHSRFMEEKEALRTQYDKIFSELRVQNEEQKKLVLELVQQKSEAISGMKIRRAEIRSRRFYEKEINDYKAELSKNKNSLTQMKLDKERANTQISDIQREWEFRLKALENESTRELDERKKQKVGLEQKMASVALKIGGSKTSLYGWLETHVPNWHQTIGKVIDEENVLFAEGLNPEKLTEFANEFYGIRLNLEAVSKRVKTVQTLKEDQVVLQNSILELQKETNRFLAETEEKKKKLKQKFQPKIKEQKEKIQDLEYAEKKAEHALDEWTVKLSDLEAKAKTEQAAQLAELDKNIEKLTEEKIRAEGNAAKIDASFNRQISVRNRELKAKVEEKEAVQNQLQQQLQTEIVKAEESTRLKVSEIQNNETTELKGKGADTEKISILDKRLAELTSELNFIENNRDLVAEYNKDKRELFDREPEFKTAKNTLDKQLEAEDGRFRQSKTVLESKRTEQQRLIQDVQKELKLIESDLQAFENFKSSEIYSGLEPYFSTVSDEFATNETAVELITALHNLDSTVVKRQRELEQGILRFTGNFNEQNVFSFKVKFTEENEYLDFAEMLKEFVEEDKLSEYKRRIEERFAHIIHQIGRETNMLIEKEGEIGKVITEINNDFVSRQFVTAVKSVELRTIESKNKIFTLLVEIKKFNEENLFNLGKPDLFSTNEQADNNRKAISLLLQLIREMRLSGEKEITLSDSFELLFKIVENDNDTGWVEKLTHVGSEGTDVLVKAMINIMLLNVFKEKASKKQKDEFRLHCMMDEIGKLHPTNVKGILKFANDRNILLINSSPTSLNAADYRYTYLLTKDKRNTTTVTRLIKKITQPVRP